MCCILHNGLCCDDNPAGVVLDDQIVRDGTNGLKEVTLLFTPTTASIYVGRYVSKKQAAFFLTEYRDGHWMVRCAELIDTKDLTHRDICK